MRLIPRWRGCLHHIIVSEISLQTRSFGLHSVTESLGISSTTLMRCAPKATDLAEITQNNGHCAIQGHRFWYQSKAKLICDFLLVINSNLPRIAPFPRYSFR